MKIAIYSILILTLFSLSGLKTSAQCEAKISMDPPNGSPGLTIQFYGDGVVPDFTFNCDEFPLPAGWSSTPFNIGSPCQSPDAYPAPDGSDYLWTGARDVSGHRFIETSGIDASNGGTIRFEIRYGVHPLAVPTSDCKGPTSVNEGVALEYSVDGGPWTRITYYLPGSIDTVFTNWNLFEYPIPLAAQAANTKFRWYQANSSNDTSDNWGLDNIEIVPNIIVSDYSWDFGDGSPVDTNKDPLHTFTDYGTYNVSLSISTSQPCTDQKDTLIYVNSSPTIDNIVELDVNSTDSSSDLTLTGISDGGIGGQVLSLSALSSNPLSLSIDNVAYTSPESTGIITVSPDSTMCGDATITASLEYTNLQTISTDELFTVHVIDKTMPVFTSCPSDIVTSILPGNCDAIITYTSPLGTDNCPGSNLIQTEGLPSGSSFPAGTTRNTFVLTDASGNQVSCSFYVTVSESVPPSITCPPDIIAAECNNTLSIAAPSISDNCGIESVIHDSPWGASYEDASGTYPVGVTIITWTVTDKSGNTATCEQRVEITPNPSQPVAPDVNVSYGETALLSATPDADHYIRWYENSDLSDIPVESSTLDLGLLTPETYYRYASQVSTITGCEGMARPVAAVVDKAVLTVTADDAAITYGDPIPILLFDYSGFVSGEDISVINEEPEIYTDADEYSDAGTYDIEFTGGYDNNYSFSFVNGVLTIEKADQTITFDDVPDELRVSEQFLLSADAESGLPVVFSFEDPSMASLSGSLMTIEEEGLITIYANNDGGTNYNPAPEVSQQISTLPSFDNSKSLFTPNGDGINDYWHIPFIDDLGTTGVKVYNRQGKLVYESTAYANNWDGSYNGNPLPEGSYYYLIYPSSGDVIKGVVNIVR